MCIRPLQYFQCETKYAHKNAWNCTNAYARKYTQMHTKDRLKKIDAQTGVSSARGLTLSCASNRSFSNGKLSSKVDLEEETDTVERFFLFFFNNIYIRHFFHFLLSLDILGLICYKQICCSLSKGILSLLSD